MSHALSPEIANAQQTAIHLAEAEKPFREWLTHEVSFLGDDVHTYRKSRLFNRPDSSYLIYDDKELYEFEHSFPKAHDGYSTSISDISAPGLQYIQTDVQTLGAIALLRQRQIKTSLDLDDLEQQTMDNLTDWLEYGRFTVHMDEVRHIESDEDRKRDMAHSFNGTSDSNGWSKGYNDYGPNQFGPEKRTTDITYDIDTPQKARQVAAFLALRIDQVADKLQPGMFAKIKNYFSPENPVELPDY